MKLTSALCAFIFAAFLAGAAQAQAACPAAAPNLQPASGTSLSTQTSDAVSITGGCINNVPVSNIGTADVSLALARGTLTLVSGGTGYAVGDTIPLDCSGCVFSTSPILAVAAVSSGAITQATLTVQGVATTVPARTRIVTLTQASTTGSGSGTIWTGAFAPTAAILSAESLLTNGAPGSLFIGAEQPSSTLSGVENLFVGDRAGGNIAFGTATTCLGHNSCGIGAGNPVGTSGSPASFSIFIGNDAGRNIATGVLNATCIGMNACRVMSGTGNVGIGQGALVASTGNNNTVVGSFSGTHLVAGGGNTILGGSVASTTLASGANNVLIGTTSSIDTASASTSNTIQIGAGSTAIWSATGTGTPSTAVSTINGTLTLPNLTTGTNADFVCASSGLVLLLQSSACTISSMRFKNILGDVSSDSALADIMALKPVAFTMKERERPNPDWNFDKPQIGLTAENVAFVNPRLAVYEQDGITPKSFRQEAIIAELVGAIQQQQREIESLKRRLP